MNHVPLDLICCLRAIPLPTVLENAIGEGEIGMSFFHIDTR